VTHNFHPEPEDDDIDEGDDQDQDSDDDEDIVARDLLNLDIIPGQIQYKTGGVIGRRAAEQEEKEDAEKQAYMKK